MPEGMEVPEAAMDVVRGAFEEHPYASRLAFAKGKLSLLYRRGITAPLYVAGYKSMNLGSSKSADTEVSPRFRELCDNATFLANFVHWHIGGDGSMEANYGSSMNMMLSGRPTDENTLCAVLLSFLSRHLCLILSTEAGTISASPYKKKSSGGYVTTVNLLKTSGALLAMCRFIVPAVLDMVARCGVLGFSRKSFKMAKVLHGAGTVTDDELGMAADLQDRCREEKDFDDYEGHFENLRERGRDRQRRAAEGATEAKASS